MRSEIEAQTTTEQIQLRREPTLGGSYHYHLSKLGSSSEHHTTRLR